MTPLRWIALGAVLAALTVSHGYAYRQGKGAEAARHEAARQALQADLFDLADRHSALAADLAEARAAQDTLLTEFEDDARRDPGSADRRPSPDSLRRLEALWTRAGPRP